MCQIYKRTRSVSTLVTKVQSCTGSGKWAGLYRNKNLQASADTYTVRYNANGGTGTMEESNFAIGAARTLSANAFTKANYLFKGWNTRADGSGISYTDKQSVKDLAAVKHVITLYAQWEGVTDENYLESCESYPSCLNLTVTNVSGYLRSRPSDTGTALRSLRADEKMVSTGLYRNSEGEYWYQVRTNSDGESGYIYAGNAVAGTIADTTVNFGVTLAKYNIPKGNSCSIQGSVSDNHGLLYSVTGVLDDSDSDTAEQKVTITSGFGNVKNTKLNANLGFGKLSRGRGTLTITAVLRSAYSSDGKTMAWKTFSSGSVLNFTVIGTYNVVYNSNTTDAVTGMPGNQTKTDKKNLTLSGNVPQRAGYIFLGWARDEDADEADYLPGDTLKEDTAAGNLNLYALWEADEVTITINPNGGTGGISTQVIQANGTYTLPKADSFTREGYTLLGYADTAAATAPKYLPGAKYTASADKTFYVVWQQAYGAGYCTVTYDANGGEGAPASQTAAMGKELTLSAAVPTRSGYTFLGWATTADAASPSCYPGIAYTITGDLTLYAVWEKANTYTIRYQTDLPARNIPDAQIKYEGEQLILSDLVPVSDSEDFVFKGWGVEIEGESVTFQPGDAYTVDADATLWTLWELAPISVYDANAGKYWQISRLTNAVTEVASFDTGNLAHITITLNPSEDMKERYPDIQQWYDSFSFGIVPDSGSSVDLTISGNSFDFYISKGSYSASTSVSCADSFDFSETKDLTFNICVLYFLEIDEASGLVSGMKTAEFVGNYPYGGTNMHSDKGDGYTFLGWSKTYGATEAELPPVFEWNFAEDTTVYAVWQKDTAADTYTVTYDANGGENAPEAQTEEVGTDLTLHDLIPVRTGFTFLGWSEDQNAAEAAYAPGASYTGNESVTLYAVWKLEPIYLYDVNAGKYWTISREGFAVEEAAPFSTGDLAHITITLNPSEGVKAGYADIQKWYDDYDFAVAPLGEGDGYLKISGNVFDFYVSKGTYYDCRNGAAGARSFDFSETKNLTFDIYKLTFNASYEDDSDVSHALFIGNYPYSGEMASYPTREGYTFEGWSTTPDADTAEYAPAFEWDFAEDITVYAVWTENP